MVEIDVKQRLLKSGGCMFTIFEYIPTKENIKFQQVSREWYDRIMPRANIRIPMPAVNLIFESQRKHISIGFWRDNIRDCTAQSLLKIGDREGEISPAQLGFSEVYFQYFIPIAYRTYAAFPIEQEAILKKGFLVSFDARWNFQSSEPMTELVDNTMRPTACLLEDR